ncbi:hypothetical protein [Flavobacterium granuli]|nr:hypothetical protein [Flavobacterium granuli]
MIGCLRTDFTDAHYLITGDTDGALKAVDIPQLEQGHIQADMGRI